MGRIDNGVQRDGARYLFALRLVPIVPFFVVNLAMGLTQMKPATFAWVSWLGMLPVTILYVNAGSKLAAVRSAGDLVNWPLLSALVAAALFPFAAKGVLERRRTRHIYAPWPRPKHTDYNLVVIGAGSAGLATAYLAAAVQARVALVERAKMGGDCLNTGCVPSKALIRSAKLAAEGRKASSYGLNGQLRPDFAAIMERVRTVIERTAPHDSVERYRSLGVDVLHGEARITSPWTVDVGGRTLTTRNIVVATGAEPIMPAIPGIDQVEPLTSETVWSLTKLPQTLLIVGGGPVGCELAQAFARFGAKVIMVGSAPRLIEREDEVASEAMRALLIAEGVELHLAITVERFERRRGQFLARLKDGSELAFDRVLVGAGRRPRVHGFGLEALGLLENDKLVVDDRLRTRVPNIAAAGDVLGQLQFTHAAGHYASYAVVNTLFGSVRSWPVDTRAFPSVTYTDPEIARAGLTEREAHEKGIAFDVTTYDIAELDRAIADGANVGFIRVLTGRGKDKIIGATIVSARAGDLISEMTFAMTRGLGLAAILSTIHPYPGWMAANQALAGEWRRAHAPAWALRLSRRWLEWRRG
jgi:pyruvate/2-oxoglutarate dehydrogenase complex dihydrolipoamide dehydrogenase (E3) component